MFELDNDIDTPLENQTTKEKRKQQQKIWDKTYRDKNLELLRMKDAARKRQLMLDPNYKAKAYAANKKWRDQYAKREKGWRPRTREEKAENHRLYMTNYYHEKLKTNPTKHANRKLTDFNNTIKYKYSLNRQEYLLLLQKSVGACTICELQTHRLHIDHDHKTGKVRGLLCALCNAALGKLEQKGWLEKAKIYLEQ
jgi:hypothetical protein